MKEKAQVIQILRKLLLKIKNQFNKSVKAIRIDHGSEFLSTNTQTLIEDFRIIHQKSSTYTPQQNGVVERRHRMIMQ